MFKKFSLHLAGVAGALMLGMQLVSAQHLTLPPSGDNKKATVSEQIGITDVTIHYSRPGVRGREGKIWGHLVPYGFTDLGFGPRKPAPWRAGANENTTITFTNDVKVEGKDLPAGTYGLHMAPEKDACTVIFSKNSTSWGSYFYEEAEDALRVNVKPEPLEKSVEFLKYEFTSQTPNSCLTNNVNLEEALTWSEKAVSEPYIGQANFFTLNTKAQILKKLGRVPEADAAMKLAMDKGDVLQIHGYGRQLLAQKQAKEALDVFLFNAKKNGTTWPVNVGLARGYSAVGDTKKALKYAKLALTQAPDAANKSSIETLIKTLGESKAVN
jgi:tetratricopeptide (TPR) repeat protein